MNEAQKKLILERKNNLLVNFRVQIILSIIFLLSFVWFSFIQPSILGWLIFLLFIISMIFTGKTSKELWEIDYKLAENFDSKKIMKKTTKIENLSEPQRKEIKKVLNYIVSKKKSGYDETKIKGILQKKGLDEETADRLIRLSKN